MTADKRPKKRARWAAYMLVSALVSVGGCSTNNGAESKSASQQGISKHPSELAGAKLLSFGKTGWETKSISTDLKPLPCSDYYDAQVMIEGRLYPSVAQAHEFQNGSIDSMADMVENGTFKGMPWLTIDEKLKASRETFEFGRYRKVIMTNGVTGVIRVPQITKPPEQQAEEYDRDPVISAIIAANKRSPSSTSIKSPVTVAGVRYQLCKAERIRNIGSKNSNQSWARANVGFRYLVLYFKVTNLGKEEIEFNRRYNSIAGPDGHLYVADLYSNSAVAEQKHLSEPDTLLAGQSVLVADAIAVPDNISNHNLRYLIAELPDGDIDRMRIPFKLIVPDDR